MKTIRIFISSPGDVTKERQRAREVVESLRRRYSRHFMLEPVLWEDLPLQSDASFQQGIDTVLSEKGADIAIFILWSRLGSPLGHSIPKPDGTPYRSGTEREYDLITQARATSLAAEGVARPHLLVYTRRDDASFEEALRGTSTGEKEELIRQKKLVEQFLSETFKDQDTGHNIGAYFPFDRPTTFSQRLRTHLQNLLDQMAGESTEVIWDIEKQGPPFLGLEAFQPQHAPVFFGREEEILEARRALKEQARDGCAFLLLSGASGSGKSSLARAGVLPAITELEVDEQVAGWRSLVITPSELGADPITALVARLAATDLLDGPAASAASLTDLAAGLKKDPELTFSLRLKDAFAQTATRQGGSVRLLLLLDQLEELFNTSTLSTADRTAFLTVVETFARSGSVWVLATVRSDFYQQVQLEPALVRMKSGHGQLDVLPPGPDALQRLIEEPARLAGLIFEKRGDQSLSSRIIRDAATHAELLPLVEFVLRELYEQRSATRQLTFAAYEALGGVEGALAKRADETHAALPGDAQESLAIVLQALVTLDNDASGGGGEKIVRQRAPLADFDTKPAAKALVDAFITARLFTTCQIESTGEPAVTVAHESLLRVWPRAKAWAEQNKDFLHTRARVAARMAEGSPLLAGDPLLEVAKALLSTRPEAFTAGQKDYIQTAITNAEAKIHHAARKRRFVLCGLATLTLVALATGGYAFIKRAEALRDRDLAKQAEMQAEAKRQEAEKSSLEAKQQSKISDHTTNFLRGMFDSINPATSKLRVISVREVLDAAAKKIDGAFQGEPQVEIQIRRNIGKIYDQLGLSEIALKHYEAALSLNAKISVNKDEFKNHLILSEVGGCLFSLGRFEEAVSHYKTSLAMRQRIFKGDHPDVAISLSNLAQVLVELERFEEALPIHQAALEMKQRVFSNDHPSVATSLGNVGACLSGLGRFEEALKNDQAALEMRMRMHKGDHYDIVSSLYTVAIRLDEKGQFSDAFQKRQTALEMLSRMLSNDPKNMMTVLSLALIRIETAVDLSTEGKTEEAKNYYGQALAAAESALTFDGANKRAQEYLLTCRSELGMDLAEVVVQEVLPDSQAERIGIRKGDIIVRYSDRKIASSFGFIRHVKKTKGDAIPLEIRRDRKILKITVKEGKLGAALSLRAVSGTESPLPGTEPKENR